MGGYVAMLQQASDRPYAGLAILGTTNLWVNPLRLPPEFIDSAATAEGRSLLTEQIVAGMNDLYIEADRTPMAHWFNLDDVPPAVVAFDTKTTSTVVPRLCAAAGGVPGITKEEAGRIDVPVLLAYGEVDVSPAPRQEVAVFSSSPDVTVTVLARSGHCHNLASTRAVLWRRIASWCASVID
jgi:pimeloyl-ACP methyl ester carboxylesterase